MSKLNPAQLCQPTLKLWKDVAKPKSAHNDRYRCITILVPFLQNSGSKFLDFLANKGLELSGQQQSCILDCLKVDQVVLSLAFSKISAGNR